IEEAVWTEQASVLIADPVVAYMPDATDTNSDHSVRRALGRLKPLAERTRCAVVCVRHWRKGASENPLHRSGGSVGFIAAGRSGLVVGIDPDDESKRRRVLAVSKANLAPIAPSLAFQLVPSEDPQYARVEWLGVSDHAAHALTSGLKERSAIHEAEDFLRERL